MTDKIVLVTPPDDIKTDGVRILLVDLTPAQTEILSQALFLLPPSIDVTGIVYNWHSSDDVEWLLDKKLKSDIIVFNAESENDIIVGYMAAQPNSHYVGTLKLLTSVNTSAIYTVDQAFNLLEKLLNKYEIR